jgi:elongator complex protein 3
MRKPTRTISGVVPLAVMLPPRKCDHGACIYCPTLNAPQSYTPLSPAVMRAASLEYDPKRQVLTRLNSFKEMKHPTDKIELIIMGGTFLQYPQEFQEEFVKECFDTFNGKESKDLTEAKKLNETAEYRCIALCIETRPDKCSEEDIKRMLYYGATRVEIGVQALDNKIYSLTQRGHKIKEVVDATRRLKQAGFKVGYHIMPGIPGSNPKKDLILAKKIFSDSRFRPDQIKIYPCQVLKGSLLENWFYERKYKSYTKEETFDVLLKIMKIIPRYCRVMRIMREIPPSYLISGVVNIDLRKEIEEKIRREKISIKDIRFREVGFAIRDSRHLNLDLKLKKTIYSASDGKEVFLEFINKEDILFGLLRLRIEKNSKEAIIRELHVYGPSSNLGKHEQEKWQHKGLGKKLLEEAEKISLKNKIKKLRIISGVGVREYYKKLGYSLNKEEIYMEKLLIPQSQ